MEQSSPTITPAAEPARAYAGHIDGVDNGAVHGWAVNADGAACVLRIRINDREVEGVRSDQPRPDLAEKGLSQGQGGWGVAAGDALVEGQNRIEAFFPDGRAVANSPLIIDVAAEALQAKPVWLDYYGAIDHADRISLIGWAVSSEKRGTPVVVEIEGRPPLTVLATLPRPDLVSAGLSTADGGWQVQIADQLSPGANVIHLRFPNGAALPGSPVRIEGEGAAIVTVPPPPAPAEAPVPVSRADPVVQAQPVAVPAADRPLSLAELDEVSLDDLIDAVAVGAIEVAPPPPPPEIEEAAPDMAASEPRPARGSGPGFFARLFGRG